VSLATDQKLEVKIKQNVPTSILSRECWVVTRLTLREGKDAADPKNWSKPPYRVDGTQNGFNGWDPKPGDLASVDAALAALSNPKFQPPFEYPGANFSLTPFLCSDLDHCFTEKGGDELKPWAQDYIDAHRSSVFYAERSPSGDGLHLWFDLRRVKKDPSHKTKKEEFADGKIELFARNYVTMTGDAWGKDWGERSLDQEGYARWWNYFESAKTATPVKSEAPRQTEDDQLSLLMSGRIVEAGFADSTGDSDADFRLCCILARRLNGDAKLIEQMWLSSPEQKKLLQRKHNEKDYVSRTIDKVLAGFKPKASQEVFDPEVEFPALSDCEYPDPPKEIVKELLRRSCIHVWAGMFESYKTMAAIELCDALLSERPVFDEFQVMERHPCLYLCVDMSGELFDEYAKPFNLRKHGKDFRVKKPKGDVIHAIDSPVLQFAVKGRILLLDTMLDYANIREAFQSAEWITFFQKLRALIEVHGCVAIVMLAHPTKTGAKSTSIQPAEYLKDSVTFGGKIDVGLAFSKIENSDEVFLQRIKGRGWKQRNHRFTITTRDDSGESWLDRGRFPVCVSPEECGSLGERVEGSRKGGRPANPRKEEKKEFLKKFPGITTAEAIKQLDLAFPGDKHAPRTVNNWRAEIVKHEMESQF
jgi:hypothetical protein